MMRGIAAWRSQQVFELEFADDGIDNGHFPLHNKPSQPHIHKEQKSSSICPSARYLVFVHPVFWFDVPSQLKGFQDGRVPMSGVNLRTWLQTAVAGGLCLA